MAVWHAPIPFLAALLLSWFVIWKIIQREFPTRLANAQSTNDMLRERLDRTEVAEAVSIVSTAQQVEATKQAIEVGAPSALTSAIKAQPEPEVFVPSNLTAEFIRGMFEGRTEVQALAMLKDVVGKWISVTGPVITVNQGISGQLLVSIRQGDALTICYFDPSNEEVRRLSVGDIVTIQGKIFDISVLGILLNPCRLVDSPSA